MKLGFSSFSLSMDHVSSKRMGGDLELLVFALELLRHRIDDVAYLFEFHEVVGGEDLKVAAAWFRVVHCTLDLEEKPALSEFVNIYLFAEPTRRGDIAFLQHDAQSGNNLYFDFSFGADTTHDWILPSVNRVNY
ncbi:MAG TPA: hypothetical protein VF791_05070 [Pyrinomonadaceae bacterium]